MGDVEKLARRICWMGFVRPSKTGWTEVSYWHTLSEQVHEKYREEARWLCWAVDRLNGTKLGPAILQRAIIERAARVGKP